MPKNMETGKTELSADDLALLSAVFIIIGDVVALLSILKARQEKKTADAEVLPAIVAEEI
ncbi:hypothetical protein ACFQWB_06420 [Paenibacillus thermoaerophilus]|uniref:Uncharacterized protein n=1 Tax=Paenibacillus thermoaerophilus TaxID=1215385 RepID=A0ABW2V0A1_9BACL|nr:hypothetical protein [Paenibacillus thermoaerophilus]TMV18171.1 hypothetical protein FE781_04240 [Paenibacillus thermoaerophilus]